MITKHLFRQFQSGVEGERNCSVALVTTPLLKLTQGFSASALLTFWARPPFTVKTPTHFQTRQQHPWLLPTRCPSTSSCRIKDVWRHCQCPLWANLSQLGTTELMLTYYATSSNSNWQPFQSLQALQITYFRGLDLYHNHPFDYHSLRNHHYLNSSNIKIPNSVTGPLSLLSSSHFFPPAESVSPSLPMLGPGQCAWSHSWTPEYCLIDLRNHQDHLQCKLALNWDFAIFLFYFSMNAYYTGIALTPLKCLYLLKVSTQSLPRGYYSFLPEGRQRSSDMSLINFPSHYLIHNRSLNNYVFKFKKEKHHGLYWLYLKEQSLWRKKALNF